MSEREALEQAIRDGVLSKEQGEKLQGYLAKGGDPYGSEDPENLSFLSSFNDIFLSLGLMILLAGSSLFFGWALFSMVPVLMMGPIVSLGVAAFAWVLSEYFCARRRLLLPSMVLALAFCTLVGTGVGSILVKLLADNGGKLALEGAQAGAQNMDELFSFMLPKLFGNSYWTILATAIAGLVYYARFRLPFSLFIVALSGAAMFYAFSFENNGYRLFGASVVFMVGVATLVAAMWFDARDPSRRTRQSDNAFWLHLAAAPQIMLGMRFMILGDSVMSETGSSVLMLIGLFAVGILSLALNRRALIFSGLVTFTLVVFSLVEKSGLSGVEMVALPLVIVGMAVVLLGAGWKTARNAILKFMPTGGLWSRLFPPEHLLSGKNQ